MLCCARRKLSGLEVRLIAMIMNLYNVKGYNLCRKRKNVNLYTLNLKVSLPTRCERKLYFQENPIKVHIIVAVKKLKKTTC